MFILCRSLTHDPPCVLQGITLDHRSRYINIDSSRFMASLSLRSRYLGEVNIDRWIDIIVFTMYISPFAAVSLLGVVGLAETFPCCPVSAQFLYDFADFHLPSDNVRANMANMSQGTSNHNER